MGEGDIPSGVSKLTVPEAACSLGISPEAVRNRLSRGTLKSVKEAGTVYVLLEGDRPQHISDIPTDRPPDISRELVEELRDRVRSLEDKLQQANDRDRENRRIIAALTSRIPELPPSSTERPSEAAQSTWESLREEPERVGTRSSGEEAPEPTERRSLWQRLFGG
jgi:hypothetical protein